MKWEKHKQVTEIRAWMYREIQAILDTAEQRIQEVN
jgi:hypothetical protein